MISLTTFKDYSLLYKSGCDGKTAAAAVAVVALLVGTGNGSGSSNGNGFVSRGDLLGECLDSEGKSRGVRTEEGSHLGREPGLLTHRHSK